MFEVQTLLWVTFEVNVLVVVFKDIADAQAVACHY